MCRTSGRAHPDFDLIKKYNADAIVDYFMSFFADYSDDKLRKDNDFHGILWNLLAVYSNDGHGFEYHEELLDSRAFRRVMHYISKYSAIMLRLLLSNVWGPVFRSIVRHSRA